MKTVDIVKIGAGLATSYGAGCVMKDIFKAMLPEAESTSAKVFRWLGISAISGVVGYLSEKWVKDQIDDIVAAVQMTKEAWAEAKDIIADSREDDNHLDISEAASNLADKVVKMTEIYEEGDEQNETKEEVEDGGKADADGGEPQA